MIVLSSIAPFTDRYYRHYESGEYACIVCGDALFSSETKYESGSGWPAFYDVMDAAKIMTRDDASGGESFSLNKRHCTRHYEVERLHSMKLSLLNHEVIFLVSPVTH